MPRMTNAEIIEVVTAYEADDVRLLKGLLKTRPLGNDAEAPWQVIAAPGWAFNQSEYRYTPAARMPVWVNLYETNGAPRTVPGYCHQSRAIADAKAGMDRVACVKVFPGDGLEDVNGLA